MLICSQSLAVIYRGLQKELRLSHGVVYVAPRLGFLWWRNNGADVNDVLKTLLPLRRHSRPGQLDWFSPTSLLPPHLWQPNKGPQSHAEAQQRHKARAGVPDEDGDTSEMDGRGERGRKEWRAGGAASVWAQRLHLTKSGWPQGGSNSFRGSTLTGVQAHPDKYQALYLLWAHRYPFMGFDTRFRVMSFLKFRPTRASPD